MNAVVISWNRYGSFLSHLLCVIFVIVSSDEAVLLSYCNWCYMKCAVVNHSVYLNLIQFMHNLHSFCWLIKVGWYWRQLAPMLLLSQGGWCRYQLCCDGTGGCRFDCRLINHPFLRLLSTFCKQLCPCTNDSFPV